MTKNPNQMTVGQLLAALESVDTKLSLRLSCGLGIGRAASYRGYYEDLALIPDSVGTVEDAITAIRSVKTIEGYKGGTYTVGPDTAVWVSTWGGVSDVYPVSLRVVTTQQGERYALLVTDWEWVRPCEFDEDGEGGK